MKHIPTNRPEDGSFLLPKPEHGIEVEFTPKWLDDAQIDTLIEIVERHGLTCGGNNPTIIEFDQPPNSLIVQKLWHELRAALPVESMHVQTSYFS